MGTRLIDLAEVAAATGTWLLAANTRSIMQFSSSQGRRGGRFLAGEPPPRGAGFVDPPPERYTSPRTSQFGRLDKPGLRHPGQGLPPLASASAASARVALPSAASDLRRSFSRRSLIGRHQRRQRRIRSRA